MHRIFISYSRSDYSTVTQLIREIEHLTGEGACWIDLTGIESDSQFIDVIIDAIDQADIFLFMYSKHSERSEWTRKEIEYANSEKKRIVFVNLDKSPLSKYFKFQFSGHDIIDISDRLQKGKLLDNLACWCGANNGSLKPTYHGGDETGNAVPSISRFIKKARARIKTLSPSSVAKYVLALFFKITLYFFLIVSFLYFIIACTDGYGPDFHFFSGFMLVLSITGCLFIRFKLTRVTFKNRIEKIILLYAPVALYLCSFIVYQCTESSAEEMDEAVKDSKLDSTTNAEDSIYNTTDIYEETVLKNVSEKKKQQHTEKEGDVPVNPEPYTRDKESVHENVHEKKEEDFVNASYPGGVESLQQDLARNIVYPAIAQEQGIQGKVLVRFTVMTDGSISDITVEQSLSKECDQAAIEAVRKLSKFIPGKKQGHPVAVLLHLPVTFKLN